METLTIHQLAAAARGRRLELGLSQAELAERLRVSRRWVHDFEVGTGGASIGAVLNLADVLGLPLRLDRGQVRETRQDAFTLDAVIAAHRAR
jgi:transcriptional regulator with XRE-family HTH domain